MLLFKEEVKMGILMKKKDLESTLRRLEADLEDLEETMSFNLSYTSAHIGGAQFRKDEETLEELRQEIDRIRTLLKECETSAAGTVPQVMTEVVEHAGDDGIVYYVERFERTISTTDIDFQVENTLGCEACSQHARNLACPPFSPPFLRHTNGKNRAKVIGYRVSLDQFPQQAVEERYHAAFGEVRGLLVNELLEDRRHGRVVAGAGACLACKECAAVHGESECRNPAMMIYSLESMGVNIVALSEKALDLRLEWSGGSRTAEYVIAIGAVFND